MCTLSYVVVGERTNLAILYTIGIACSSALPDCGAHLQAVLAQVASAICKNYTFLIKKYNNPGVMNNANKEADTARKEDSSCALS